MSIIIVHRICTPIPNTSPKVGKVCREGMLSEPEDEGTSKWKLHDVK